MALLRTQETEGVLVVSFSVDWWPSWGGYAIAAILALIPARGRLGLGLGILAGMAAVPNLWRHYLPTVAVGFLLVAFDLRDSHDAQARGPTGDAHRPPTPRSH